MGFQFHKIVRDKRIFVSAFGILLSFFSFFLLVPSVANCDWHAAGLPQHSCTPAFTPVCTWPLHFQYLCTKCHFHFPTLVFPEEVEGLRWYLSHQRPVVLKGNLVSWDKDTEIEVKPIVTLVILRWATSTLKHLLVTDTFLLVLPWCFCQGSIQNGH